MTPSITETQVLTALRALVVTIVNCEVVRLPANRVPTPASAFVGLSPVSNIPLATNVASYTDTQKSVERSSQITIQIDCYGAGSGDRATAISALLRDSYACEQFAASGFDIQPLYAGDAKQLPLVDGEQQYEERWSFEAVLQFNPVITMPQDSATSLTPVVVNVERTYPP